MDAHLVFNGAAVDAVALAHAAVGVHMELGHDEQRDATAAGRGVGQAGQHQVDDVLGHVVLAGGDEDLLAGNAVGTVALRLGLAAQQTQIGAGVRLGQAHGAGPLTAGELGQVGGLLLGGAVRMQGIVGAVGQTRIHGPGLVGAVEHLVDRLIQRHGQALAAVVGVAGQRGPTTGHELAIGVGKTRRRGHGMGLRVQRAADLVALAVEREQHLGRELAALFEHCVDGVSVQLGMCRHGLERLFDLQHFVKHKLHIAQRRGVLTHACLLNGVAS